MDVVERGSKLKEFRNADTASPIYSRFDRIACVSQKALNRFREKFGDYPDMVAVHNPLLDEQIRDRSREFSVERRKPVEFVTVGRIAEEKGFDRLAAAAAKLKNENFNFLVRIVGDGGKRQELEQYIQSEHLEDVVFLEGFRSNPYPYIAAADWYVCSSLDEGCPLTIGEAFCLGKPVLGTDCSGVREWLGDSCYGIVMENSTDGIYMGLKRVLLMDDAEKVCWKHVAEEHCHKLSFDKEFSAWQKDMLGD